MLLIMNARNVRSLSRQERERGRGRGREREGKLIKWPTYYCRLPTDRGDQFPERDREREGDREGAMLTLKLALALALLGSLSSGPGIEASLMLHQRQRDSTDIKDKIIELQCLARCNNHNNNNNNYSQPQRCLEQCKLELLRAPRAGSCPTVSSSSMAMHARQPRLSCLVNCVHDYDCVEVQKCCASACGPICTEPLGVRNATQLPPIPKILRFKMPRSHKVELTIESSLLPYYFHVEVRSHIGRLFAPRKLGAWQAQPAEQILETTDGRNKQ